MGASITRQRQDYKQKTFTEMYNKCKNRTVDGMTIDGFKFRAPSFCNASSNVDMRQTNNIDANCLIGATQKTVSDLASKLNSTAKAGLGISVTDTSNTIEQQINQKITDKCQNESETKADFRNVDIESCHASIVQDVTGKQVCQINAAQDLLTKAVQNSNAKALGYSFFDGIGGKILIAVIVLAAIAALVTIITLIVKKAGKKGQSSEIDGEQVGGLFSLLGGDSFGNIVKQNKSCSVLLIIILILLILFIIGSNKSAKNNMTLEQNIVDLNRRISDAKQIAGTNELLAGPHSALLTSPYLPKPY